MKDLHIEYRKFTNDDFSATPKCFENEFENQTTRLFRYDNCGMILNEKDNPHYYFHNMDLNNSRWACMIRLGDGPLSLQTEVEGTKMAQTEQMVPYCQIQKDPCLYQVKTLDETMNFTYDENGCRWIEGENGRILDVTGTWFPYGLICHMGSEYNIPFMHLPVHLKGTYLGKPVEFLACIDRIFGPEGKEKEILINATSYLSSYCSGIREDGRREWFIGLICHDNGKGLGIYYLDGQEPIISDDVVNVGVWEKLPYVDDGTVVCVDNIWKFGGQVFHVKGQYGAKGFAATPRFDRHGQSQVFGYWYAGEKEYRHRIWNTFSENMEAYYESMKQRGFIVKD